MDVTEVSHFKLEAGWNLAEEDLNSCDLKSLHKLYRLELPKFSQIFIELRVTGLRNFGIG